MQRFSANNGEALKTANGVTSLYDGQWQGRPDFLRRVPVASDLGDWSYEVLDTNSDGHVDCSTMDRAVHQLNRTRLQLAWALRAMPAYAAATTTAASVVFLRTLERWAGVMAVSVRSFVGTKDCEAR